MRNMKRFSKILAVLLCVVLAVGVVFTLSSCNKCDHANVTKQNTATCTAAGVEASVCNDCGETISETPVDALGHTYQADAAASVAVTCTADGKNVEKCTRCGDVKETVISKLNHNFQLDATKCVFATCTASGLEVKTCANCSALSSTILPALNHNFVENGESVAATCTTAGKTVIECTRADCHEKNETPINALGHDWDIPAGTVAVACLDVNCKRCDAVQVATEPHSYGGVATVNHCDKPGTETRTCTLCRHEEVVEIPSIAHNVPTWTKNSTVLGVSQTNPCEKTYSQSGVCTGCGETITEKYTSVSHDYGLEVTNEATCKEAGTQEMVCKHCDATNPAFAKVEFFAEHTFGEFSTPDTNGKSTSTCSTCYETRTKFTTPTATVTKEELKEEVELQGGAVVDLGEGNADNLTGDATLGANSFKKDELTGVGADALDKLDENDTIYNLTLTYANGDSVTEFTSGKVTVKLPYTLGDDEDPSHITIYYLNGNEIEEMDAVFTSVNGKEGFVTFETDHFSYYLVGIYSDAGFCKRFGHEYIVAQREATCTKSGYYLESCKRCGTVNEDTRSVESALGHEFVTSGEPTNATCTTDGSQRYVCETCDFGYNKLIHATGHHWSITDENPSSCQAPGFVEFGCTNGCGSSYEVSLPQTAHTYSDTVIAPTCTERGYTLHTCTTCPSNPYSYMDNYKDALGHRWNIEAPTCGQGQVCTVCAKEGAPATGVHTIVNGTCSVCGLGCQHNYIVKETVHASCSTGGYTVKQCTVCNNEIQTDQKPALSHNYIAGSIVCSNCNQADASLIKINLDYTLKAEDVHFTATTVTLTNGTETGRDVEAEVDFDLYECYLISSDGKILIYANGTVSVAEGTTEMEMETTVYGDGEYIYTKVPVNPYYDSISSTETSIMRTSYSEFFYDMLYEFDLEDLVNEGDSAEDMITSIMVYFSNMINSAAGNELLAPWFEFLEGNMSDMESTTKELVLSLFIATEVTEGTKYTLDIAKINEFNTDLKTLTVAQLIDKYFGEGTFENVMTFLESLETKTLPEATTELLDFLAGMDISADLVLNTINSYCREMMEDPTFDIMEMINSDDYKDITVAELIMEIISNMGGSNNDDHGCYDKSGDGYCDYCGAPLNYVDNIPDSGNKDEPNIDFETDSGSNGEESGDVNVGESGEMADAFKPVLTPTSGKIEGVLGSEDSEKLEGSESSDNSGNLDGSEGNNGSDDSSNGDTSQEPEEEMTYADIMAMIREKATTTILYNLMPTDMANQIYDLVDGLLDSSKLSPYIVLDANDEFVSCGFDVTALELMVYTSTRTDAEENTIKTEGWINASFKFSITKGAAEIPADADAIKNEYLAAYEKLMATIAVNLANPDNENQLVLTNSSYYGRIVLTSDNGVIYVKNIYLDGMTPIIYEIPLSEFNFEITTDCTNAYKIYDYISKKIEDAEGNTRYVSFPVSFYFNSETHEIKFESFHEHNEYTGEIPEGVYITYEEAPCSSVYGEFYTCSCGYIGRDTHRKSHDTESVATLLPGSVSCEDGVEIYEICKNCDYQSTPRTSYYHQNSYVEEKSYESENSHGGKVSIRYYECACGRNNNIEYYSYENENDCRFENGSFENGNEIRRCTHDGCEYFITITSESYRTEWNGDPCYRCYEQTVILWNAEGSIHSGKSYSYSKSHQTRPVYTLSDGSDTCIDGLSYTYVCELCGYTEDYTYTTSGNHSTNLNKDKSFTAETAHGSIVLNCYECPCGYYSFIDFGDYYGGEKKNHCVFNDRINEESIMDNETQIGTQFRQNCATEGCNDYYLIVSEYYPVPSTFKGDSCIEVYKTVYAVYNAKDELVKEIECNRYSAYHQDVVTSYELYEDSICCKDGYYIICTCQDCKKEINRWPDAGYYGIIKTNETLTLPSGGTYEITLCSCLCGCINYIEDPYGYAETSETEPVQVTHHGYNCFTKTVKTYTFYENGYDTPFATRTVEIYSESHDIVDDGNGREYCKNCNYKNYDVTTTDSHGRTTEYLRLRVSCTGKIMSHQHWGYNYISSDSCQGYYGYCNGNCDEGLQWSSHTETRHTVEQYVHELGTCTQPSVIREKCKICTEYSNLNEWYYYRDENGYNWSAGHNWTNTDDGSEFEYVCERCGLFSNQGSSYTCLEDLTNHEGTYSKENMFAIGYLKHRYSSTKPYVAFSFVDKDMNYTEEGATITVGSIFAEYEHKEDYIYGYYTHCGHGVIYFDKDSVLESIQLLIDNNVVDMTVDEFLAAYDLAVTVQENETVDYEKNDGYYSVIVLEDLASYFTAE